MKMTEYYRTIHSNPDAQAWAKFFIDTMKEQGWKLEHIDEGLMVGWFANAMMAMHDHIHQKREWVGLTDAERKAVWHDSLGFYRNIESASKEIERLLKEKNYDN